MECLKKKKPWKIEQVFDAVMLSSTDGNSFSGTSRREFQLGLWCTGWFRRSLRNPDLFVRTDRHNALERALDGECSRGITFLQM
jgi:hypothetical protein